MRDIETSALWTHNSTETLNPAAAPAERHSGKNKAKCGSFTNEPSSEDQQHKMKLMQRYFDDNSN